MVFAFFQVKAKRDREQMPLEERMKQFRELLTEKDISAYSPWEKELHKIVFDPRSGHHQLHFFYKRSSIYLEGKYMTPHWVLYAPNCLDF